MGCSGRPETDDLEAVGMSSNIGARILGFALVLAVALSGLPTGVSASASRPNASSSLGSAWSWGDDSSGQLGNGSTVGSTIPLLIPNLPTLTAVAAGESHSLGLGSDGTVWSWGSNYAVRLGVQTVCTGSTSCYSTTPVQVPNLTGVVAVSGGGAHSLALKSDGTVWTWGDDYFGELGDNPSCLLATNCISISPIQVPGLTGITAISGGEGYSLALSSGGTVWGWGNNTNGQLATGQFNSYYQPVTSPTTALNLSGVAALAGGYDHALFLKTDGTVWAAGYNGSGQLGNGTNTPSDVAVQTSGLTGVLQVSAGSDRSFAVTSDGSLWAW